MWSSWWSEEKSSDEEQKIRSIWIVYESLVYESWSEERSATEVEKMRDLNAEAAPKLGYQLSLFGGEAFTL